MGGRGSGGLNKVSVKQHVLQGTFRPDRHALALKEWQAQQQALPASVSKADRRRVLRGLGAEARRLAVRLLDEFEWDTPGLVTLRNYVLSCERVEALQATHPSDSRPLLRELRSNLALLKALDLEHER